MKDGSLRGAKPIQRKNTFDGARLLRSGQQAGSVIMMQEEENVSKCDLSFECNINCYGFC